MMASARSPCSEAVPRRARPIGDDGYRNEDAGDAAVLAACAAVLTDEVVTRTREIIAEALATSARTDTRATERDRLTRDIATAERRIEAARELVLDSTGAERDDHCASLRRQLDRLAALQGQLREVDAQQAPPAPRALLEDFDGRMRGLRDTLAAGDLGALPAIQAILGNQRLTALRTPDGCWELRGKAGVAVYFQARGSQVAPMCFPTVELWAVA
jgi:hypothetical protein